MRFLSQSTNSLASKLNREREGAVRLSPGSWSCLGPSASCQDRGRRNMSRRTSTAAALNSVTGGGGGDLVTQSCRLFATPWTLVHQAPLCPWDSPGRNTGVGCHVLLPGIFPTQGSNPGLLHRQADALALSHLGNPWEARCGFESTFLSRMTLGRVISPPDLYPHLRNRNKRSAGAQSLVQVS